MIKKSCSFKFGVQTHFFFSVNPLLFLAPATTSLLLKYVLTYALGKFDANEIAFQILLSISAVISTKIETYGNDFWRYSFCYDKTQLGRYFHE